jgi:predicted peroxiredoxin
MLLNPAETPFIRDGKAEVQVWLSEKTDEAFAQLKELGFELVLDPKSSKMIIGRLPVEKLEALAKLKFVKYVAPAALK